MSYGETRGLARGFQAFQGQLDRSRNIKRQQVADAQQAERERQNLERFKREQDLYGVEDRQNEQGLTLGDQRIEAGGLNLERAHRTNELQSLTHEGEKGLALRRQVDEGQVLDQAPVLRGLDIDQRRTNLESSQVGIDQQHANIASTRAGTTRTHLSNNAQRLVNQVAQENYAFMDENRGLIDGNRKADIVKRHTEHSDRNFEHSIRSLTVDPSGRAAAEILNNDPTNGVNTAARVAIVKNAQGVEEYVVYDADDNIVSATNPASPGSAPVPLVRDKAGVDKGLTPDEKWNKLSDDTLFTDSGKTKKIPGGPVGSGAGGGASGSGLGAMNANQRGTFKIGNDIIGKKYGGSFDSVSQQWSIPEENADDYVQAMAAYERRMTASFGNPANNAYQVLTEMGVAVRTEDTEPVKGSVLGNYTAGLLGITDKEAAAANAANPQGLTRQDLQSSYALGDGRSPGGLAPAPEQAQQPASSLNEVGTKVVMSDGSETSLSQKAAEKIRSSVEVGQTVTFGQNAGAMAGRSFKLTSTGALQEVPGNGQQ